MSILMRQSGGTVNERKKFVMESVNVAKEAVQQDVKDGKSWGMLL